MNLVDMDNRENEIFSVPEMNLNNGICTNENINNDLVLNNRVITLEYSDELFRREMNNNPIKAEGCTNEPESNLCRLCATSKSETDLIPIFTTENHQVVDYLEICVPGMIIEDDGLPQHICFRCKHNLRKCSRILNSFYSAHRKLQCKHNSFICEKTIKENGQFNNKSPLQSCKIEDVTISDNEETEDCPVLTYLLNNEDSLKNSSELRAYKKELEESNPLELIETEESPKSPEEKTNDDQKFTCQVCGKIFQTNSLFIKHQRIHKKNVCNICGKIFSSEKYLKTHMYTHLSTKQFTCKICSKSFRQASVLSRHMKIHNEEKTRDFICQICGLTFKSALHLDQHMEIHSEKKHQCDVCGMCFHRKGNLDVHRNKHDTINSDYSCCMCKMIFIRRSDLRMHWKICNKKRMYKCNICDKEFLSKALWKVHNQVHSKEQPFQCELCDKSFISFKALQAHMKVHKEYFPHECKYCGHKFKEQNSLITHYKTHISDDMLICAFCDLTFFSQEELIEHAKTHQDEELCNVYMELLHHNGELNQSES